MTLSETTIELLDFIKQNPNPTLLDSDLLAHTYQNLIDTLIEHNHLYYIESSPIISDYEYDQLFSYLKNIEEIAPHLITSNSPTQSLIGQISEGFAKANHRTPLLSLENSYNAQDLTNRDTRIKKYSKNLIRIVRSFTVLNQNLMGSAAKSSIKTDFLRKQLPEVMEKPEKTSPSM